MTTIYPIIDILLETDTPLPAEDLSSIDTSAESEKIQYLVIPEDLIPVGTDLIITSDPAQCLMLFRPEVWQTFSGLLLNLQNTANVIAALQRVVLGNARFGTVDTQHRLELAQDLASFAHLGTSAYWLPVGEHVELWSTDSFDENVRGSFLRLLRQLARYED